MLNSANQPEPLFPERYIWRLILPGLILMAGVIIGLEYHRNQKDNINHRLQDMLNQRASLISEELTERISLYQYAIFGLRGAVMSQGLSNFSRHSMQEYAYSHKFALKFAGALGFGLVKKVDDDDIEAFIQHESALQGSPFIYKPYDGPKLDARKNAHYIIVYMEPEAKNLEVIGRDVQLTEGTLNRSSELDGPVLSPVLPLLQKVNGNRPLGLVMSLPIYRYSDVEPELRKEETIAWAVAVMIIDEVIATVRSIKPFESASPDIFTYLTDITDNSGHLLFQDEPNEVALPGLGITQDFDILGRVWQLRMVPSQKTQQIFGRSELQYSHVIISAMALLLAGVTFVGQVAWHRRTLLHSKRNELAAIVTNANEAIISCDRNGRITNWNPSATRMFGFKAHEVIGKTTYEKIVPVHCHAEERVLFQEVLENHQRFSVDSVRQTKDRRLIYVSVNASPILNEKGELTGAAMTLTDISELKEAHQALQKANSELESQVEERTREIGEIARLQQSIVLASPYAIIATDMDGVITLFNPAAQQITQYSAIEVVGLQTPALLISAPDVYQRSATYIEKECREKAVFESLIENIYQNQRQIREWIFHKKNGDQCKVALSVASLLDEQGEPGGYLFIAFDLTEKKRLEYELEVTKISTERTPDAMFWVDESGLIIRVNPAAAKLLRSHSQELIGTPFLQYDRDNHISDWLNFWDKLQDVPQISFDTHLVNGNGKQASVSVTSTFIEIDNQKLAYLVARDISDRLKREEELAAAKKHADAANNAKSAFLANMSHEIRTPMNAILGMLQLIQQTELTIRQQEYVKKTESAGRSLLAILNDILDFSKVEAGKMELDPHCFEFYGFMQDLGVLLSANISSKDVEVLYDIDDNVPEHLIGDSLRIKQVLINLAGNAIKFTEKGQVVISVKIKQRQQQQITLCFTVKDSGIGMTPVQLSQIFTGFTQAEGSISRRFGGTGLGLTISKRLVELMGGQINVASEAGVGSQFSFSLVLNEPKPDEIPQSSPISDRPELQNLHVLVVDDNPYARDILSHLAQTLGWQVDAVDSGRAALEKLQQNQQSDQRYQLVFLDWRMPDLDGWETAEKIRDLFKQQDLPLLVMVTAYGRELLAKRHISSNELLNGFLVKPVTKSVLLEAVSDALAGRNSAHVAKVSKSTHAARLQGVRLLLVEDNPINQLVAGELLESEGASVTIASGGTFALQELESQVVPFDLILMDLQMPDMDGFETTRRIRMNKAFVDIPIIAMTANVMESDKKASRDAGMKDHVGKPFELDDLVNVILANVGKLPLHTSQSLVSKNTDKELVQLNENCIAQANAININLTKAVEQMGNSVSLYRRSFAGFITQLEQDYQRIIQEEDSHNLHILFHTMKGNAATLGISELAAFAKSWEQTCKKGRFTQKNLQSAFEQTVIPLLPQLKRLSDSFDDCFGDSKDTQRPPTETISVEQITENIRNLSILLSSFNMDAIQCFEELKGHLDFAGPNALKQLEQSVHGLDFASAKTQLDQILEAMITQ